MTHRPTVTDAQLTAVLRPLGTPVLLEPLSGGMFASAHRATLADGTRAVVKVTGTDPAHLCRYERGIARTEAAVYTTLAGHGLPVPAVLLTDFSHRTVDGDVVVTAHLPGTPWNERDLGPVAQVAARRALGALMADLHRVTAPAFGYPAEESGMRADDWRTAFTTMVEGLLADAARTGTPVPAARIRAAVRAHGAALDAVVSPVVVHTDLWPANVFLDDHETIVGLIDTERTVWGDPLLDLVGADQLGLWDVDPDLLAGDTAAGGGLSAALASPAGPTRFALCRLYFSLILVTEIDVRGYDEGWVPEHRRRVAALLDAALARLGA